MVTPGWIRRGTRTWDERDGIVGVVAVAGGSVVVGGGLVVVDGVVVRRGDRREQDEKHD